jgi:transposase
MKRRSHNRVVFKPYVQGQLQMPNDLEELVPAGHLVRVVDGAIERMDLKPLLRQYAGGGTSSYHPKMMLKVLVYAYAQQIYSSRQIAKALRENVNFMWLSGNSHPDFRTINRFRGEVMRGIIQEVFGAVLELLVEAGYVKLEHYSLDGTKIEANADRYQWVWAKSTRKHREKLQEKVITRGRGYAAVCSKATRNGNLASTCTAPGKSGFGSKWGGDVARGPPRMILAPWT